MRACIFCMPVYCLMAVLASLQTTDNALSSFNLKNSSLLPGKVTTISYQPAEPGNGTEGVTILPGSVKKLRYKEGTLIYRQ